MIALTLTLLLNGTPFPLPAVDGKALAVTDKQKTFRLPMRFEKVRAFYDEQFAKEKDVSLKVSGAGGARVLALTSKRKGDRWTKATVKEGELETIIDVTPVMELGPTEVTGTGTPLVQFVFQRSKEVDKALEQTADPLVK
jgi:hypothetical protein